MNVGIVVSNFYPKISKMLIDGAISKLKKNKISNFEIITVPGTFEIPVVVSNLINKYELVDYWMNTNLMCIGEKTSSSLNIVKWKKIFFFNPGEEEFLINKL